MIKYARVTKEGKLKFFPNKTAFKAYKNQENRPFVRLFDGSVFFVVGAVIGHYIGQYFDFHSLEIPLYYFMAIVFSACFSAYIGVRLCKLIRLYLIYLRSTNQE